MFVIFEAPLLFIQAVNAREYLFQMILKGVCSCSAFFIKTHLCLHGPYMYTYLENMEISKYMGHSTGDSPTKFFLRLIFFFLSLLKNI